MRTPSSRGQGAALRRAERPAARWDVDAGARPLRRRPIAAGTDARLLAETFVARTERGAGIPAVEKLQYFGEMAQAQLEGLRHLVLVDAVAGVVLRLPGKPSDLVPEGCTVHVLAGRRRRRPPLAALADARRRADRAIDAAAPPPTGALTGRASPRAVAATLPERASSPTRAPPTACG